MEHKVIYEELIEKLKSHQHWINVDGGARLVLDCCDLREALEHFTKEDWKMNWNFAIVTNSNMSGICCTDVKFTNVNFSGNDMSNSLLLRCVFISACMKGVNLTNTIISSDLSFANLKDAIFSDGTELSCSALYKATLDKNQRCRQGMILNKSIIGYKVCSNYRKGKQIIVKLLIPKGAVVFNINNFKCRTNTAEVLSISDGLARVPSDYDPEFIYEVHKIKTVKDFNLSYNVECAEGIHFFRTLKDLQKYCGSMIYQIPSDVEHLENIYAIISSDMEDTNQ